MRRQEQGRYGTTGGAGVLLGLVLGVACAHAVPARTTVAAAPLAAPTVAPPVAAVPAKPPAPAPAPPSIAAEDQRNPSAEQVADILRHAGFHYETVDPGKRWRVTFAGHSQPTIDVDIVYNDHYTIVLGRLFTLPDSADRDVYKLIAERNFDLEQMKLSVDHRGAVFASFEVPTRILDRRELLENIVSLAAALDSIRLDGGGTPSAEEPRPPQGGIQKIATPPPPPLPERTL